MQTNVAMNADYTGDLGTNEADGYGGELDHVSNNSLHFSPRVANGGKPIELQPLMANSQKAPSNPYAYEGL